MRHKATGAVRAVKTMSKVGPGRKGEHVRMGTTGTMGTIHKWETVLSDRFELNELVWTMANHQTNSNHILVCFQHFSTSCKEAQRSTLHMANSWHNA
jgi:hypothetical protein